MMPESVQAFLGAADDLLAAQQALMPHPLSEELRALTEAYIAMRAAYPPIAYAKGRAVTVSCSVAYFVSTP
jgi:hypothetical protein